MKKATGNEELEFTQLLKAAGRQCQSEYRLGRTTSFGRCQEFHLKTANSFAGPVHLSVVKINKTKRLYCQKHAREIAERLAQSTLMGVGTRLATDPQQLDLLGYR